MIDALQRALLETALPVPPGAPEALLALPAPVPQVFPAAPPVQATAVTSEAVEPHGGALAVLPDTDNSEYSVQAYNSVKWKTDSRQRPLVDCCDATGKPCLSYRQARLQRLNTKKRGALPHSTECPLAQQALNGKNVNKKPKLTH